MGDLKLYAKNAPIRLRYPVGENVQQRYRPEIWY